MKRKPRWTLEMLTASLAVLCGLLLLVLLVQRPMAWPLLAVLVVLWGSGSGLCGCLPEADTAAEQPADGCHGKRGLL